jgi:hypothetical protein
MGYQANGRYRQQRQCRPDKFSHYVSDSLERFAEFHRRNPLTPHTIQGKRNGQHSHEKGANQGCSICPNTGGGCRGEGDLEGIKNGVLAHHNRHKKQANEPRAPTAPLQPPLIPTHTFALPR